MKHRSDALGIDGFSPSLALRRGGMTAALACGVAGAVLLASVGDADAAYPRRGHYKRMQQAKQAKQTKQVKKDPPPKPLKVPLIVVSIGSQRVTVYDEDKVVVQSSVSTGVPGHPTPTGVFSVIQKDRFHRSNIYSGAPMPYMQRITWSGVAMHGGVLPGHPASHGCIRLYHDFAARLWGMTRIGARVIVARQDVKPVEFDHARLFDVKPAAALQTPPAPQRDGAVTNLVRTAEAATGVSDAAPAAVVKPADDAAKNTNPAMTPAASSPAPAQSSLVPYGPERPLRPGPVTVFVSRKEGKLFVRKQFQPIFEAPVKFKNPEQAVGTHVYTAVDFKDDNAKLRWTAVTLPAELPKKAEARGSDRHGKHSRSRREVEPDKKVQAPAVPAPPPSSASEALERVEMTPEAITRISSLMSPGATLIISDQGMGYETGLETDFIVLVR